MRERTKGDLKILRKKRSWTHGSTSWSKWSQLNAFWWWYLLTFQNCCNVYHPSTPIHFHSDCISAQVAAPLIVKPPKSKKLNVTPSWNNNQTKEDRQSKSPQHPCLSVTRVIRILQAKSWTCLRSNSKLQVDDVSTASLPPVKTKQLKKKSNTRGCQQAHLCTPSNPSWQAKTKKKRTITK
jgi:hypothetical protein